MRYCNFDTHLFSYQNKTESVEFLRDIARSFGNVHTHTHKKKKKKKL